jgi:hypothetical protein
VTGGRPISSYGLTAAALALAGVGLTMNGWLTLGSTDLAGWLFLAIGVASDLVALAVPPTAADPQADAANKIEAWLSAGTAKPGADGFAMLRLMLLALLLQIGGILLMVGRARQRKQL